MNSNLSFINGENHIENIRSVTSVLTEKIATKGGVEGLGLIYAYRSDKLSLDRIYSAVDFR
jgi:hypothetical protein